MAATPSPIGSGLSRGWSQNYRQAPTGDTIPDPLSVEENGRLYNAYREGKYLLPNDGDEQDRLDLQHHAWMLALDGKHCLAPVKEDGYVLDIGTGTGIWCIQFARLHPGTKVIGTDISLIQPKHNTPPNCQFIREDADDLWVFDHKFDLIHWKLMFTCFDSHKDIITKIFDNLNPGGWINLADTAGEAIGADAAAQERIDNSAWAKWLQYLVAGGKAIGRDFNVAKKYKQYMIEAGFVDVVEEQIFSPFNPWPLNPRDKQIGNWNALQGMQMVGTTAKVLQLGGLRPEETDDFLEDVRRDFMDPSMRGYGIIYVVYGRKPEA